MSRSRSVDLLRDYVAIPSLNPMGRSDIPAALVGETRYAEHVCEQLRRIGLDACTLGEDERRSVIAEARAAEAIDTVMIASHLDTVPVDGMEIDPFDPAIREDRLFGRGSCDTKAGMAAAIAALETVLRAGTLRRNVVLVGEADEELGSRGVFDVLDHLGGDRPDWVLATEPTSLQIVTHHKGIAVIRLHASGRACHSSNPSLGRNAIVDASRAVLALAELGERLGERSDPTLGAPTLSVGRIGGGQAPNIVPNEAWILTDRRMLPGESVEGVRAEVEDALLRHGVENVRVEDCRMEKGPLGTAPDAPATRACRGALEHCGVVPELGSVAFGTDAGVFATHGWSGIVFGPGSIDLAHTAREHVPIGEVETAERFYRALFEGSEGAP